MQDNTATLSTSVNFRISHIFACVVGCMKAHKHLTRYIQLCVAHAPGMPGTFSQPPWVSDPDMQHGTCLTPVPWCIPGLLTRGFLWSWRRGKLSCIPGACATHNFAYLVRDPWPTAIWSAWYQRRSNFEMNMVPISILYYWNSVTSWNSCRVIHIYANKLGHRWFR